MVLFGDVNFAILTVLVVCFALAAVANDAFTSLLPMAGAVFRWVPPTHRQLGL